MVIRISRRFVRIVLTVTLVIGSLCGLYFLGRALTPRDGAGRPVLLSPSVWAAEQYRRAVVSWLDRMRALDGDLQALLDEDETDLTDPGALYRAGEQAQQLTARAADLVRAATFTPAPVALAELRDRAVAAAEGYWKATAATARWVGAPEEKARQEALAALESARRARQELESSRWVRQWD